ncbi:MAG: hypothetical protein COS89_02065 [Deltaproteobacteria bacterium CG07_land_8_20_14_0_80_38_7]|nr:MAG: hypothetical protein COS89_02065 [Deltaproteobacteria bacterium CG07_land_8_20_14_0_80_38_7]
MVAAPFSAKSGSAFGGRVRNLRRLQPKADPPLAEKPAATKVLHLMISATTSQRRRIILTQSRGREGCYLSLDAEGDVDQCRSLDTNED